PGHHGITFGAPDFVPVHVATLRHAPPPFGFASRSVVSRSSNPVVVNRPPSNVSTALIVFITRLRDAASANVPSLLIVPGKSRVPWSFSTNVVAPAVWRTSPGLLNTVPGAKLPHVSL